MWASSFSVRSIGRGLIHLYALAAAAILLYPTVQLFIVAASDDIVFPPRYFSLEPLNQLVSSFLGTIPFSIGLGEITTIVVLALCLPTTYLTMRFRFLGC